MEGLAGKSVASGVKDSLGSVFFFGVNGICGGDSQTILYSTDSGASWQIGQTEFFGGGFPGAHMLSPSIGFRGRTKFDFSTFGGRHYRWWS